MEGEERNTRVGHYQAWYGRAEYRERAWAGHYLDLAEAEARDQQVAMDYWERQVLGCDYRTESEQSAANS